MCHSKNNVSSFVVSKKLFLYFFDALYFNFKKFFIFSVASEIRKKVRKIKKLFTKKLENFSALISSLSTIILSLSHLLKILYPKDLKKLLLY